MGKGEILFGCPVKIDIYNSLYERDVLLQSESCCARDWSCGKWYVMQPG